MMSERTLAKGEVELNRDEDRNGIAEPHSRPEVPLPGGFDRFEIEAKRPVERTEDLHVANAAVRPHDALKKNGPLQTGSHGV
jgi:hypothetical protein